MPRGSKKLQIAQNMAAPEAPEESTEDQNIDMNAEDDNDTDSNHDQESNNDNNSYISSVQTTNATSDQAGTGQEANSNGETQPKRKRGRPEGTKNKSKIDIILDNQKKILDKLVKIEYAFN